jgi:hypothetical protein
LGDLLAVTNDNIRPLIIIQNERNKYTFDTCACTIDQVSLVLEKTCFAGHIFEYKWKTYQKAQTKLKCTKEIRREAHQHNLPGQSTTVGGVQAQSRAHRSKAVASGAS